LKCYEHGLTWDAAISYSAHGIFVLDITQAYFLNIQLGVNVTHRWGPQEYVKWIALLLKPM